MGFCCCFVILLQAYTMVFTCSASANILMFTVLQTQQTEETIGILITSERNKRNKIDFTLILIKLHTNFVYGNPGSDSIKTHKYSIYTL